MDPKQRQELDDQMKEAAFVCDFMRVRDLLKQGANVNVRDDEMRTPLHQAVLGGMTGLVGLLLESGADVNAKDQDGFSPLHFAAQEFLPEIARILIAKGADLDLRDGDGNTPLHRALISARGRLDVVAALVDAGAKDDLPNLAGATARELAEEFGTSLSKGN